MKTALLSLITALSLTTLTFAAAPMGSANVGQADFTGEWPCPAMSSGTFADIPSLSVTLTTSGGPLLVMWNLYLANVSATQPSNSAFTVPTINGQAFENDMLQTAFSGVAVASFHRLYPVTSGVHGVKVQMTCPLSDIELWRGWLTVYELPLIRK